MRLDFETILGILFFIVFFIVPAFSRRRKKPPEEESVGPQQAPTPGAPVRGGPEAAESRGRQPQPARPATPAAPTARPPGQARASTQPPARGRPPQGASPSAQQAAPPRSQRPPAADSIDEALEEIRARVREAQQQEDGRQGARAAARQAPSGQAPSGGGQAARPGLTGGDRTGGGLVSGQAKTLSGRPVSSSRGASGATSASPARPPRPASLGREGVAEPLKVTRRRRAAEGERAKRQRGDSPWDDAIQPGAGSAARLDAPLLATDRRSLVTGMIWHEILAEPAAKRLRRTRSRHP